MIWILYNLLFAVGFTLMLPKFLWRMRRRGGYRNDFLQRFGVYRPEVREALAGGGFVWIHAVSVGELFVALQFMTRLRERRPGTKFVLSTTTSTGYAIGREKVVAPDVLIYFPVDLPIISRRALAAIKPVALVLVEGEIWPNLIRHTAARGIPLFLVNGRVSESSYRGYRMLRAFTRRIFPLFRVLCLQSEDDRARLEELGAPADRLLVLNSAKYEISGPPADAVQRARDLLDQVGIGSDRIVLLGGSTWPGEEDILLRHYRALRQTDSRLALVLAPRHVERTPEVLQLLAEQEMSVIRRSEVNGQPAAADVFLIDTTGELTSFYPSASIVFVGKSLTAEGGQNPIEPAVSERAIVVGPNMQNFPVVIDDFKQADALRQVRDEVELKQQLESLIRNEDERLALGKRAGELVRAKSGGIGASVDRILEALS